MRPPASALPPGPEGRPGCRSRLAWQLLAGAVGILIAAWLMGRQVLEAKFGIVDDHEIVWFLGSGSRLAWTDILPIVLERTEVGRPWDAGRFRPFYYLARVTETALWGDSPALWYAARVLMFGTFIGCVLDATRRLVGLPAACVLVAYIVLLPLWSGIWDRLGPAEIYAACGLGIWFASGTALLLDPAPRRASLLGLVVGTAMMCGSKETLLPFALLSVALLVLRRRRISTAAWYLALLGCVLPAAAIAWVMTVQLRLAGSDVYGRSVGLGARVPILLDAAWRVIPPAAALAAIALIARLWSDRERWNRATLAFGGAVAAILLVYGSQAVVYGRSAVITPRYELPALLCLPALWLALTAYLGSVDSLYGRFLRFRQAIFIAVLVVSHQFATSQGDRSRADSSSLPAAVATNIAATQMFARSLDSVVGESQADPSRPIILEAKGGIAYEAVASVVRFLRHADIANPVAIRFRGAASDAESDFMRSLALTLQRIQDQGLEARGDDPYRLLSNMVWTLQDGERPGGVRIVPLPQLDERARAGAIVWPVN